MFCPPFPSVADVFYVSSYLIVTAGLALLIRSVERERNWGGLIDAAIVSVGLGLLSWQFLIRPYVEAEALPLVARLVAIDYPFMGVAWVALATRLLFASRSPRPPALYLLLMAVVFHPIADAIYSWQVIHDTHTTGTAVVVGWILSYAFFGAARPTLEENPVSRRRLRRHRATPGVEPGAVYPLTSGTCRRPFPSVKSQS
jgi:hypothetical protein